MDPVSLQARSRPDAPAVVSAEGAAVTYGELDALVEERARTLVNAFRAAGRGQVENSGGAGASIVAIRFRPTLQGVVAIHAVWRTGAVLLPLNPSLSDPQLERTLPPEWAPHFILTEGEDGAGMLEQTEAVARPSAAPRGTPPPRGTSIPRASDHHPVVVMLTSGTDGLPTAVPISRANLELSARGSAARLSLAEADRWLWTLSPAHIGGLALVHRAAFLGGAVQPLPRFNGEAAAAMLSHPGFTHASLVPVMLHDLLEAWGQGPPPPQLRCLLLGGAATPRGLVERAVAAGFPVALTYGLTQATSQVATNPPEAVAQELSWGGDLTVGMPLPGVSVEIVGADARGVGEIRVRGGTVALPSSADGRGGGAYLDTSDLGVLEGSGRLRVVGRQSRRIISGGVNVEPGEVEAVLLRHPAVREVVVLGRPHPRWGEEVVALVVAKPGQAGVQLTELLEFTRPLLPSAARPRGLRVVEALPRNVNGKVDMGAVRALFQEP